MSGTPSKTALAVLALQRELPSARVLYCSATGAQDPDTLGYMVRLGTSGFPSTRELLEQAIELLEDHGTPQRLAEATRKLGNHAFYAGDYAEAERHFRRGLELCREHGYLEEQAGLWNNLGYAVREQGRLREAEGALLRALDVDGDGSVKSEEFMSCLEELRKVIDGVLSAAGLGVGGGGEGGDEPEWSIAGWLRSLPLHTPLVKALAAPSGTDAFEFAKDALPAALDDRLRKSKLEGLAPLLSTGLGKRRAVAESVKFVPRRLELAHLR